MKASLACLFICICSLASQQALGANYLFGAYFANWAQYHSAPYGPYTATDLQGIIKDVDYILYAFAYFDNRTFQLQTVETRDPEFYSTIAGFKQQNPGLKMVISIGGWNYPSRYFSDMVATTASRSAFVNSAAAFLRQYQFDGIDLDWEYPCSEPRIDWIKITDTFFKEIIDDGGRCPQDTVNLLSLVKELRQALGSEAIITIAGQADADKMAYFNLKEMSNYITRWHVMSYDYSVSDIADATTTAPNCPLYNPPMTGLASNDSVHTSIQGYIAAGVPKSQIMVGAALYGHTWYVPGLTGTAWQKYGLTASKQLACHGPFKDTYGAGPGVGSKMCGTLMYSEILDVLGQNAGFLEPTSQTMIGYTNQGVWLTYDNDLTIAKKAQYVKDNGLAGIFAFDTSMDTISGGSYTYTLMKLMRRTLGPQAPAAPAVTPAPVPSPSPAPSSCQNKAPGTYCVDQNNFEYCPQGIKEPCAAGTVCKQTTSTEIQCTWPTY